MPRNQELEADERVFHVQTGSPGVVVHVDRELVAIQFDGASGIVVVDRSQLVRNDPLRRGWGDSGTAV